ncbi:MAG: TIGR03943 family protein, partial [Moorea sp. SIO2I5]|nr:TIGR03943 family protein [Moorena sp. SIO2I5]
VEGNMITETLDDKRQLVIEASGIKKIPEPENPYYY